MTHFTDVHGVRVAYTDVGEGPAIVFMHGNPDSRHSWCPVFDALGGGFRLIAPDFPGFGDSEPFAPDVEMTPVRMAEFWNAFITEVVGDAAVTVVVHDFGGPWLLPWTIENPQRVRSALILNTLFHRDFPWHRWARLWQCPLVGELTMALSSRWLFRRVMSKNAPGVPRKLIDESYERMHPTMRRTVLRVYRAHANPAVVFAGWEERFLDVAARVPVRVLWGDRDPYIDARFADRFGGSVRHLPELGHWIYLQAPNIVANELRELIA